MIGITSFGAYIPRMRLQRAAIAQANTWFDPSLKALARGERSMCNWDEDTITMAVEAGRDAIAAAARKAMDALFLASANMPFLDRQNAGVVAEALNLGSALRAVDVCGSQRAGTSALLSALDAVNSRCESTLLIASDHRRTRVGTPLEMLSGDAAAALALGADNVLARFIGSHSITSDFVDHFRTQESEFDYDWEERWIRDEGYLKLVPDAVGAVLEKTGLGITDINHFILPCAQKRVPPAVARRLGLDDAALVDNLLDNCGQTGVAHPILLLAHTLERARAGDHILLTGFGQGCDALVFEVTDSIGALELRAVSDCLERGMAEENYAKFQTFNGLVEREYGKRAEADMPVRPSALYRNRKMINGFLGGRCTACGTVQFPKAVYCVNPQCGKAHSQEDQPMAQARGRVLTWTADRLTFDMNPPAYFGLVEFDGGGRAMLDFTDVNPQTFDVGTEVRVHFRIKQFDKLRGFRAYFWKAAPVN